MGDYYTVAAIQASTSDKVTAEKDNSEAYSDYQFRSRRSPLICCNGCVASSQPLASSIGIDVLRRGGNACDASIAMAGALAVLEPFNTGLGGDMFAMYYEASSKNISCINGSGRAPRNLTLEKALNYNEQNPDLFSTSPVCVTVPGAARGWEELLEKHGSGDFTMEMLLEPAVQLAEQGFPVAPVTANHWTSGMKPVHYWHSQLLELGLCPKTPVPFTLPETGMPPRAGQLYRNPDLAKVLRSLGKHGASEGFYNAFPGQAIVETLRALGGVMELDDLVSHRSTFPDPINVSYRGLKLWQVPPNTQGVASLIALKGLEALEKNKKVDIASCHPSQRYHTLMEMMRLGFHDTRAHVADDIHPDRIKWLLDEERISQRAINLYHPSRATTHLYDGYGDSPTGTVGFNIIDIHGNAISFVNSNYLGFGTGIVPTGCGFSLQNRGYGFSLNASHPNAFGPHKRPYHTILPGLLTYEDTDELYAAILNIGGFMQPQGILQLAVNLIARGMDPQSAVDEMRFCIADGTHDGKALLEAGISDATISELIGMGHNIVPNITGHDRSVFGKAQVIKRDRTNGVLWAGSDGRCDGCAMGY